MLSVVCVGSSSHAILCLSLVTPQVPAATTRLTVAFDGRENLNRKWCSTHLLQDGGPPSFQDTGSSTNHPFCNTHMETKDAVIRWSSGPG